MQKALKLEILKALKNPIIRRKKRAKKERIVAKISAVQGFTGRHQNPRNPPPNPRLETTEQSPAPATESTDDDDGSESGSIQQLSHKNSKKKRKAGRTRLNKFKVQNCGDGNDCAAQATKTAAHVILTRKLLSDSGELDQNLEPHNLDAASEGPRAKKMTRAEKADAASKVKESLPRYLRINTLLGMPFREVQKALLTSGCVCHSHAQAPAQPR
jgi:hypothetical protein